jgi:hypothetical protein
MLMRTIKKTKTIFGLLLISTLAYSGFYIINKPAYVSTNNHFIEDISYYQTHDNKNAVFMVTWLTPLKRDSAANPDNFIIEQVKREGRNWVSIPNGKKCKMGFIQYVYAPWVDTEKKRSKAEPSERNKRVTQMFVYIEPREEIGDYYKVTIKNVEPVSGEKMLQEEFGIVSVTKFNRLIKM